MNNQPVYEIVVFKSAEGVTSDQVIAAAQGVHTWLENYDGFISRQLIQTDDQWVDFVTWESMEQAHAAASEIMQQPVGQAFGAVIDPNSIQMMHGVAAFSLVKE